ADAEGRSEDSPGGVGAGCSRRDAGQPVGRRGCGQAGRCSVGEGNERGRGTRHSRRGLAGGAVSRRRSEHPRHHHHRNRAVRSLEMESAARARDHRAVRDLDRRRWQHSRMTVALRTADAFPSTCEDCRTEVSEQVLVCPRCHRLVHARTLAALRDEANAAAARGDRHAELQAWQSAIRLVPPTSRQHAILTAKIESLETPSKTTPDAPADPPTTGPWKWLSGLGALGAIIWKLKFLLVALLGKGKLLLLGLTKAGTVLSMLLAFGVYWPAWGMWFAL